MSSIFTKIIDGEIPCHKVAETEHYFAFLDIAPFVEAHTLVIPKREVDYIFDLTDEELSGLICFAKRVAKAIEEVTGCPRMALAVMGLEVPHAHIHLGPIRSEGDFRPENRAKTPPTSDELAETARKIRSVYERDNR